jgi:hypothetical protein
LFFLSCKAQNKKPFWTVPVNAPTYFGDPTPPIMQLVIRILGG